jgi:Coproporphyrinogen III oxidase and related Fe-S oxidoreductases
MKRDTGNMKNIIFPFISFVFSLCARSTVSYSTLTYKRDSCTPFPGQRFDCSLHSHHKDAHHYSDEDEGTGFYIHIPYCRRRCHYCDFAIVPIGSKEQSDKALSGFRRMDESYRHAVNTEIDLLVQSLTKIETRGNKVIPLSSIYFGGGTPSLAPIETIKSILDRILGADGPFYLDDGAEVTMEMDPGTFSEEYLMELKKIGVNRISLGVQSFSDEILENIGRVHRKKDIDDATQMIESAFHGDANYSIDLISGLPGLDIKSWEQTVHTAMALKPSPNHVSVYDLQIEEGTVFGKIYSAEGEDDRNFQFMKKVERIDAPLSARTVMTLPCPEECASMYRRASEILQEYGFEHYEISSYAKYIDPHRKGDDSSFRSKHNQVYWGLDSCWYAVGMGATSSMGGKRFARPRHLADYIDWVEKERRSVDSETSYVHDWQPKSVNEVEESDQDTIIDTIMTRLRTKEGLDLNWINRRDKAGKHLLASVMKGAELGIELGLAKIEYKDSTLGHDKGTLYLTDPDGFLFSNSIISSIFAELVD